MFPKVHMKFTKASIEQIKLPDGKREVIVFDDTLAGFGLRIRAGGKRVWIAQYRLGSRQRRLTLGSVQKLNLDVARKRAKEALSKVDLGTDPQIEKIEARANAALTLKSVIDIYVHSYAEKRLRPNTLVGVRRYLYQHWRVLLSLPARSVTRSHVATQLSAIARDNGQYASNRARATLSSLFSWAIAEGIVDTNPVVGTRKAVFEKPRDRVLTNEELKLVWQHSDQGDFGMIVRLLILTGQRREEVAAMRWSEIDLNARQWSIGSERTKNGQNHTIYLSNAATTILRERHQSIQRDLVFGTKGPFSGWSKSKARIDARIAIFLGGQKMNEWRVHDLQIGRAHV